MNIQWCPSIPDSLLDFTGFFLGPIRPLVFFLKTTIRDPSTHITFVAALRPTTKCIFSKIDYQSPIFLGSDYHKNHMLGKKSNMHNYSTIQVLEIKLAVNILYKIVGDEVAC